MPIRLSSLLIASALLAAATAAPAQVVNPLGDETQAPQAQSSGPAAAPAASRGQLVADPATGGQAFIDERGWYRFTMAGGGSTSLNGTLRIFQFVSGGVNAACFAVRTENDTFAKFSMDQIQSELDTLYPTFDEAILANNVTILGRGSISLSAGGQAGIDPVRVLAWDTRDANGLLLTYALAPLPAGQLVFACGAGSADHAREIIARYLRIAEGAVIPAR